MKTKVPPNNKKAGTKQIANKHPHKPEIQTQDQTDKRQFKKRTERIKTLPVDTKKLILFWFASCRQQIIASYQNIFRHSSKMEIKGEKVGNDYGWSGMLLSLANGIVHLEQVSKQPFHDGLIYLSYLEDQRLMQEIKSLTLT